jgi:oxygen-dependent protoporphyrinogen oxidase
MARIAIAGGGISGLSLAYALSYEKNIEVMVFESEETPGGKIRTDRSDGFLTEWGVNGFLDNKPKTLELAEMLSLKPLRSSDAARKRYILRKGRLRMIPDSPPSFLKSDVLSIAGKLRLAYEIFAPRGDENDESLADFARRRLGREAYESLIDPMASGIYAGDPEKLSLKSCFPKIHELETTYGSLIKGMFKLQAEAKRKKTGKKVGAGPGGTLTSFPGGMQEIINGLKERLGGALRVKSRVIAIDKKNKGYVMHLSDGTSVETDIAVVATPAYSASAILKEFDRTASSTLLEIPYPAVSVVCLGYKEDKVPGPVDLFGFLIPYKEGRRILGTLYDSSIFPNRAPEGHVLLRVMVGGARAPGLALEEEGKMLKTVMEELRGIAGIKAEPDFHRIYRHEKAIPQYTVGHSARLKTLEEAVSRHKGLYLAGNAYRGISMNDCIENSFNLAGKIIKEAL